MPYKSLANGINDLSKLYYNVCIRLCTKIIQCKSGLYLILPIATYILVNGE